jgi:hypothetical protein
LPTAPLKLRYGRQSKGMDYTIRMLSDKEDYEMKQKMIDFLLENANPSIQLRVKKEILKNLSKQEEERLQGQILEEKIIRFLGEKHDVGFQYRKRQICPYLTLCRYCAVNILPDHYRK